MENKKGSLEIICGSMFSGKTEELMRRLIRTEYAKQKVLTIKHQIDKRRSQTKISSHDGKEKHAFSIDNDANSLNKILELANKNIQVVGIDEIQFFPKEIISIVKKLIDDGKKVIAAGLDMDFRGEPFGIMPTLMSLADDVTKLKAICVVCGKDAHHTQRIINGKPAKYDDPIILVGASECYEARCRDCFKIENAPQEELTLNISQNKTSQVQI
ncbi:MAG: thymidine kinase [bacterium]